MRLPGGSADTAMLSAFIFPFLAAAVGNIDCSYIRVDQIPFNLQELGGPRSVVHSVNEGPSFTNTTYTIDLCKPLGKAKHVDKDIQCPNGTRRRLSPFVAAGNAGSRVMLRLYSLRDPAPDQ